jgi:hypothetical protein
VIEVEFSAGAALRDPVPELLGGFRRFEVLGVLAFALVGLLLTLFCLVASLRRDAPGERDFLGARAARRSDVLEEVSGVLELGRLDVLRGVCCLIGVDGGSCSD